MVSCLASRRFLKLAAHVTDLALPRSVRLLEFGIAALDGSLRCIRRDLTTGASLFAFKPVACGPNALCQVGHEYLMAAQRSKGLLRVWSWDKVQMSVGNRGMPHCGLQRLIDAAP